MNGRVKLRTAFCLLVVFLVVATSGLDLNFSDVTQYKDTDERTSRPEEVEFGHDSKTRDMEEGQSGLDSMPHDGVQGWKSLLEQILSPYSRLLEELLEEGRPPSQTARGSRDWARCRHDLARLVNNSLSGQSWALQFLDASAKPGPSLTLAFFNLHGNYEQCRDAAAPPAGGVEGFGGDYCVVTFPFPDQSFVKEIGLCVPDTCFPEAVKWLTLEAIRHYNLNVSILDTECRRADTDVTAATVCAIFILCVLGGLMLLGTLYDLVYVQQVFPTSKPVADAENGKPTATILTPIESQPSCKNYQTLPDSHSLDHSRQGSDSKSRQSVKATVLLSFSVYTNGRKLLALSNSQESITCLFGIRYLSILWIIFGHSYYFSNKYWLNDSDKMQYYLEHWTYLTASNSYPSVDTFFFLSGLLTSYLTLKEMDRKGWRINWPLFYFHRFWRLTPPYMLVLLISVGLTQYLGEGPMWANQQPRDKDYCEDGWWKNLLYINNFFNPLKSCMYHSWYLANDMQFFVISPLMMLPFHFRPLAGLITCLAFLLTTWVTTGVLSTVHHWSPTELNLHLTYDERETFQEDYYVKPWNRIGPYVIGILGGYALSKIRGQSKPEIKRWLIALGWLVSAITILAVVFGLHGDVSGNHESSTGVKALYNTVARSAWAVGVAWVVLACDSGYGGPVNTLLSWSPFQVLSRLTYMIYLLHPYVMYTFFSNLGAPFFSNNASMSVHFIGLSVFTTFLAFLLVMAFESPMIGLEKALLHRRK